MFINKAALLSLLPAFLGAVSAAPLSARGVESYTITVKNNCAFPVWPAASQQNDSPGKITGESAGSASPLAQGQSRAVIVPAPVVGGRIWGRTNCKGTGDKLTCETGDCDGLTSCTAFSSAQDATLLEFQRSGYNGAEFISINLSRQPGHFTNKPQFNVGMHLSGADDDRNCPDINCPVPQAFVNVGEGDKAAMTGYDPTKKNPVLTFCP